MNKIIKFVFATLPPMPASCSKSATAGEVEQPETYIYIRTHYLYTCVREAKGALYPLSPCTPVWMSNLVFFHKHPVKFTIKNGCISFCLAEM